MALLSIGRINFRSPFILQVPRRQTRPHLRSRRGRQREREPLGGGTLLRLGGAIAKQRRTSNICCFCLLFYMNRNFPVPSDMEKFQFCYCAKSFFDIFKITKNYVLQHLIKPSPFRAVPLAPRGAPSPSSAPPSDLPIRGRFGGDGRRRGGGGGILRRQQTRKPTRRRRRRRRLIGHHGLGQRAVLGGRVLR